MARPVSGAWLKDIKFRGNSDVLVAGLIVAIVGIIIIPMPTGILDVLLACSLASGIIMMLMSLFISEPLQISVFPTLLLVVTLFRLALDISATRCILSNAYAGEIIESFGYFVVGGNYVVGAIIFLIITLVQFVVITNGAGRTAEVSARFTLDAMPGKQMSIDADLGAGLITEQEAKQERLKLQREASFFGSMDGASKFVRGDAIAGIGIALINIIGGLIIGTWQKGMPVAEALQTYTLLTVGEGLVAQIPALLTSTATGILVTRAQTGHSFGFDLSGQIGSFPRAIGLAAVILLILAIVPGLPFLPFIILSAGTGYAAYALDKEEKQKETVQKTRQTGKTESREPENILGLFRVDPLEIEIGYNLISLIDESSGGDLLTRLGAVRRQCATEMGIFVRPIRIRDNLQLSPNAYRFKIHGIDITGGELMANYYLAMNPDDSEVTIDGIRTVEPAFGLPAWWIREDQKGKAELESFTVVDASTVLITHLTEFIKTYAHEILTRQDVQDLMDMVKQHNEVLVNELTAQLSVGEVQKVLQNLLREKVSIRDLDTILEAMADGARISKNTDYLIECTRQALTRSISKQFSRDGRITIVTVDPSLESKLVESLQTTSQGVYPAISPEITQMVYDQLEKMERQFTLLGLPLIVLCSSKIRLPLRRLIERFKPNIVLLAVNELTSDLEVDIRGAVTASEH